MISFILIILALVFIWYTIKEVAKDPKRYSYKKQYRKKWTGFNSDGLKFEWLEFNALVEDPNGDRYENGRKIKNK